MTLHAPDADLDNLLEYLGPALPPELNRHLDGIHLRDHFVEIDALHVPGLGRLRANVGLSAEAGAVRVDVQSVHKNVLGWKRVDDSVIERLPWVGPMLRRLEATPWEVPGLAVTRLELRTGRVFLDVERVP